MDSGDSTTSEAVRGFEVEIKFRVHDEAALVEHLHAMGASGGEAIRCDDLYFAHPSRDFAATDEAIRLRCEGDENRITYKGPKHGGPTKTREEIEIAYETGRDRFADMKRLLENLGFRPVATVSKTRMTFPITSLNRPMLVVIDQVAGLGKFAEVESLASNASDLPQAQAAVIDLAAALGLTDVERKSYLRMHLERLDGPLREIEGV